MKTNVETKETHTPGPWHVKPYKDSRIVAMSHKFGLATGDVPDNYEIFTEAEFDHTPKLHGPLYVGQIYKEANARLIAAAPEMAGMLRELNEFRNAAFTSERASRLEALLIKAGVPTTLP